LSAKASATADEPFCGKSTEVPFHEPFTLKTELSQSRLIVPNRVIFHVPSAKVMDVPAIRQNHAISRRSLPRIARMARMEKSLSALSAKSAVHSLVAALPCGVLCGQFIFGCGLPRWDFCAFSRQIKPNACP
jgi:hypothetical protein